MTRTWTGSAQIRGWMTLTAVALSLCLTTIVPDAQATGQDTITPVDPSRCQIDPRALPLWDGTPAALATLEQPDPATGEPADDATIRGITSTIEEATACANAGQPLRALALVTDDFLARQFVGEGGADVIESGALLERPVSPPIPEEYLAVESIEEVTTFPDGSVGAVVVTVNPSETFTDFVVFVEGETRWLIDASFPLDTTPATPGA